MKTSYLAFGTSMFGLGLIVVACGGADSSTNDVLGQPTTQSTSTSTSGASGTSTTSSTGGTSTSSSTSSGSTTSSSSSSSSSGCLCAQPPQGCTFTNPTACDCLITCPDAGTQPTACTWAKPDPCPAGMFCDAPGCGKGVCVDRALNETITNEPQCGCDGVTYFNPSVAAKNGMAIQAKAACAENVQVGCGGPLPNACPGASICNRDVKTKAQCNSIEPTGACWQMPAACTPNGATPKTARACGNGGAVGACVDECTAISSKATWYADPTCPN